MRNLFKMLFGRPESTLPPSPQEIAEKRVGDMLRSRTMDTIEWEGFFLRQIREENQELIAAVMKLVPQVVTIETLEHGLSIVQRLGLSDETAAPLKERKKMLKCARHGPGMAVSAASS